MHSEKISDPSDSRSKKEAKPGLTATPVMFPRLCAAMLGACLGFMLAMSVQAGPRQALRGHVPAAVAGSNPIIRVAGDRRLKLAIGLPLRNAESLTNLLEQLYNPLNKLAASLSAFQPSISAKCISSSEALWPSSSVKSTLA